MNSLQYFFRVVNNALVAGLGVIGQTVGAVLGWRPFRHRRTAYYAPRRQVRISPRARQAIRVAVASAVIVASVMWLCMVWRLQTGPRRDRQLDEVLGWGVAQETIRLMTEGGQVVVVAWQSDLLPGTATANEIQLQEFLRVLAERPHIRLRAVERIDSLRFDQTAMQLHDVFPELLQKYPAADLFVSFVGIPDLDTEAIQDAGHRLPKFLVIATQSPALQTFFLKKLVTVAVVPRGSSVLVTAGDLDSNAGQFERHFVVLTASNVVAGTGRSSN